MNHTTRWLRLKNGRNICYREYGHARATPVFYAHGWPGSSLEGALVARADLRVIAPERPGFGESDPQPGRTLLDWTDDATAIADTLGLERFGVLGFSGGGPYALACARRMPSRLLAAVVVNGQAPANTPGVHRGISAQHRLANLLARHAPWLLERLLARTAQAMRTGDSRAAPALAEADRTFLLEHQRVRETLRDSTLRAFRQGVAPAVAERRLYAQPWGFDPASIDVPVHIWQGLQDTSVSPRASANLAQRMPSSVAHFVDGEGHISLLLRHLEEITQPFRSPVSELIAWT